MALHNRDSNGDWMPVVSSGERLMGAEAVARLVEDRLRIFQGEWWENASVGNPALEMLREYRPTEANLVQVVNAITEYIQGTEGVIAVENVHGTVEDRRVLYSCTVVTAYGERVVAMSI